MATLDDIKIKETKEVTDTRNLPVAKSESVQLSKILDGDTLELENGRRVRLLGMDAPETKHTPEGKNQAGGVEATQALRKLFDGNKNISIIQGTPNKDKYGRTLAHVLTEDGKDVQEMLIESGNVRALTFPTNKAKSDVYQELEQRAKDSKLGIWKRPRKIVKSNYVPAFLRGDSSTDQDILPETLGNAIVTNIKNDGLATQTAHMLQDFAQEDKRDEEAKLILHMLPALMKKARIPAYYQEQIEKDAVSLEHAEILVNRIKDIEQNREAMEAMSPGMAALAGIAGFIGDPTNFIPGFLMIKAAKGISTLTKVGKLAPKALKGNAARLGAFTATEEAIRTLPRLEADPTFITEQYLANTGIAGILGGVFTKIPVIGKWTANKLVGGSYRTLTKAVQATADAATESLHLRTAVNVMRKAGKESEEVRTNKDVQDFRAAATHSPVQEARNLANEQVKQSKFLNKAKRIGNKVVNSLHDVKHDVANPEILKGLKTEINDLVQSVNELNNEPLLAAKVKVGSLLDEVEVLEGEVAKAPTAANTFKELQVIEDAVEAVALATKDTRKALMLRSAVQDAKRAIEDSLAKSGVQVIRRTNNKVETKAAITQRLDSLASSPALSKVQRSFNKVRYKLDNQDNGAQPATETLKKVADDLGLDKDERPPLKKILDWVNAKDTELRAGTVSQRVQTSLWDARQDLSDRWTGAPDRDLIDALEQIELLETAIVDTLNWTVLTGKNGAADLTKLDPEWALLSHEFETSLGDSRKKIHELYNRADQKLIKAQFGRLTRSLGTDLINTNAPLAEYQAMNIFELAPGLGGIIERPQTAALIAEGNHTEILMPALKEYHEFIKEAALALGWGKQKTNMMLHANPNVNVDLKNLLQSVQKEINSRDIGRTGTAQGFIKSYANKIAKTNDELYKIQLKHKVDGITGANKRKHYQKQKWQDGKLIDALNNPRIGKAGLVDLFANSLGTGASKLNIEDARLLAKTAVDLKLERLNSPKREGYTVDAGNDTNALPTINNILERLSKDNKNEAIERLAKNLNLTDPDGRSNFAKARVLDLDYETTLNRNGETLAIVDLLDNDVIGNIERYSKEATGMSALAEVTQGRVSSIADIDRLLNATTAQAHELGTHVNTGDLRNAYRQLIGMSYDGQLPLNWRKIRDAVSLAGMGGLGESQVAETGLAVSRGLSGMTALNQITHKTVGRIKQWSGLTLSDKQKNDTEFVNDLMEHSRLYEDMHIMQRQNVHFDDRQEVGAYKVFDKAVDTVTGGKYRPYLQYLQTRYTAYGQVRSLEEQLAITGLMQDALKMAQGKKSHGTEKRFKDLGLDIKILNKYLDNGTITLDNQGKVQTLNMQSWSEADTQAIGVAMRRHAGQVVQKHFVGELSPLMANPTVAFMMQFKSYPMLAAEKQQARQAIFHDKEAAMGITINAMSSAVARMIRYQSMAMALPEKKREEYMKKKLENDLGHDTIAYTGIAGMLVMNYDMANDLVFGSKSSIGDQLPVVNWGNNVIEAAKAANPLKEADYTERDLAAIQRGAPLGTVGVVNILMGVIRDMMVTDTKNTYKENSNRGN